MNDPPVDVGTAIARAMLSAATSVATARGILPAEMPAYVVHATGSGVPTVDACEGMLWARVGTSYPTNGDGAPFTRARPDHTPPAWAIAIELGALYCHTNITEDGGYASAADEGEFAIRDGGWRAVLQEAVGYAWWPAVDETLHPAVLGQSIGAWAPIGTDGGYSGGMLVATVIVAGLWLC